MCGLVPCMKTRVETRLDQSIKTIVQQVEKPACCPGYAETPDRKCAPICLKSCNAGKCVAPNVCSCRPAPSVDAPGFVGPTCARFTCLEENKWGSNCDRRCDCPANAYCVANTGKCACYLGWRGANCSLQCEQDDPEPDCHLEFTTPTMIEQPDVNAIEHGVSRTFERLVLQPDSLTVEKIEGQWSNDLKYLIALLSGACLILLVALFLRRRYIQYRNDIYAACSSHPSGDGSNYSTSYYSSNLSTTTPQPYSEDSFPSKNLTFASATRAFLTGTNGKDANTQTTTKDNNRNKSIFHPRVESHLILSQRPAEQNVYSDLDSNLSQRSYIVASNGLKSVPQSVTVSLPGGEEDHIYQIPKSPMRKSTEEGSRQQTFGSELERANDGKDNIYEEIKPRLPDRS